MTGPETLSIMLILCHRVMGIHYPLLVIKLHSVCPSVYDGMDYYMDTSNSPNSIDMYCNNMRPTGIPW